MVDGADFLAWQRGFGGAVTPAGSGADGDGNGLVDAGDLAVWKEHIGQTTPAAVAAIPEPTGAILSLVAAGALWRRRTAPAIVTSR